MEPHGQNKAKRRPFKTYSSLATRKVMSFVTQQREGARPPTAAERLTSAAPPVLKAPIPREGVDGFLFHFSFAPRLIQLHRSYVLFLIKAYASRRRIFPPKKAGGGYIRGWVLMIFQWGERVPSFS